MMNCEACNGTGQGEKLTERCPKCFGTGKKVLFNGIRVATPRQKGRK